MPANFLKTFALGIAVLMLGVWGLILIIDPTLVHSSFSNEPLNHTQAGMMGAAFLGLAIISFAAETGWISTQRALGIAVAVIAGVSIYLMFGPGTLLVTPLTSTSLVAAFAIAFFLMF
ncbi:MAG TPA: hypothetical protein ENK26_03750 [Gammaproteobacteria bacterium]|nr:hypothetical protein [Gammaproteobacteria bacterium]